MECKFQADFGSLAPQNYDGDLSGGLGQFKG